MAEDPTTPAAPQAGTEPVAPQPQAGNTTPGEPQAGEPQSLETISLDEARKLRSEAQNLRKREKDILAQLKTYQDAEQAQKDAQLSELEREKKQRAEIQSRYESEVRGYQERLVRYEVERQASKLGIIDPDAAARLIDWSELEFDEDGTPKNAEKLLAALVKQRPYLVPATSQQQAPASPAQSAQPTPAAALPAFNNQQQGRTSIPAPGSAPTSGRAMSVAEAYALTKQQRQGR